MIISNSVIMDMAERSLKGKWGLAIGTFLIFILITGGIQLAIHFHHFSVNLLAFILGGPLAYGAAVFSLSISRNEDARFEQIFKGFEKFGIAFTAYILMVLFIFLWALLLIVPGIIAAISYAMTFYILADEPSIGAMEAIDKSIKMMDGYKWKYFVLCLMFLLLSILCVFTLGIGFLWLVPYIHVTNAKFYDEVKGNLITV